jgi:hypothetical protein
LSLFYTLNKIFTGRIHIRIEKSIQRGTILLRYFSSFQSFVYDILPQNLFLSTMMPRQLKEGFTLLTPQGYTVDFFIEFLKCSFILTFNCNVATDHVNVRASNSLQQKSFLISNKITYQLMFLDITSKESKQRKQKKKTRKKSDTNYYHKVKL